MKLKLLDRALGSSALVRPLAVVMAILPVLANSSPTAELDEITIIAEQLFTDTTRVSPTSSFTAKELEAINVVNTEDAFAFSPGVAIRKRFIGDANGVLGIRGSNMFQTSRSMVFVDGMPLHNHLRTRFNGAPRWSLVAPNEIELAEVVYGPFSAEYSGNAMGGVVNIETKRPESRRVTLEAGYFNQDFDYLGADDNYEGYRLYAAFEDKLTDTVSALFSYTRLENDSQPQTFFHDVADPAPGDPSTATAASGFIAAKNEYGEDGFFFGDTGVEEVTTDLFRTKWFVNLESIQLRANIAYERRERDANGAVSYLEDASGTTIYDRRVDIDGEQIDTFQFGRSLFQGRLSERESLLVGLGASFELGDDWVSDFFYSVFDVIKDEEVRTGESPDAPNFDARNAAFAGRLTDFDNTNWQIFDAKFGTESFLGDDRQRLSLGAHYGSYKFDITADDYDSINGVSDSDELDGNPATGRGDSGGKAETTAVYLQYGFRPNELYDLSFGLRYEDWETKEGFNADEEFAKRESDKLSPKLSIAYFPGDESELRYSIARAVRFPIVEELYLNLEAVSAPDPNLKPEDGIFHSLTYTKSGENYKFRANVFYDVVDDVIFNQRSSNGVTTFLTVGEVTTKGAELEVTFDEAFLTELDLRVNLTYVDAEITDNFNNPEFEGKDFPRIPEYRANLIADYQLNEKVGFGGSIRYASDTFGDLDNRDTNDGGFGSFTDYVFVGVKTNVQATDDLKLSVGIDNLFNEEAFVHHPYPQRTYYFTAKYELAE